jgi:hypothetical protein
LQRLNPRVIFLSALAACVASCSKPPVPQPPSNSVTANQEFLRLGKTSLTCLSWPDGKLVVVWADIDGFTNGTSGPSLQGVRYSRTHGEIVKRQKTVREGEPRPPEPPKPPGPPVDPNALTVITTQEETGRAFAWQCDTPDGVTGSMVIGGERFDLANGNVFLVTTTPGGKVTQLTHDFWGFVVRAESFMKLAVEQEEINAFVEVANPTK